MRLPLGPRVLALLMVAISIGCGSEMPTDPNPPASDLPRDSEDPVLEVFGRAAGSPGIAVPAESVKVWVSAHDNTAISWAGYRIGPPVNRQDSAQGRGRSFSHTFDLVIDPAWVGKTEVRYFAYDCPDPVGRCDYEYIPNYAEVIADTLDVRPLTPRAYTAHALPGWSVDWAYDAKRNRVYLSERDNLRIAVFDIATGAFEPPIPLYTEPHGIDLTVSNDSLVIALRQTPYLGILDLTQSPPVLDTVRLGFDEERGRGARFVRVASNDKAIISLTTDGSGGGQLWEYDLRTGMAQRRLDVGRNALGINSGVVPLARSADRSTVLLIEDDLCCPTQAAVYDAAVDQFSAMVPVANRFFPEHAVTGNGGTILVDHVLFDRALTPLAVADPEDYEFDFYYGNAQAIDLYGTALYFTTRYGYTTISTTTGAVTERVSLPQVPRKWMFLPDGETLLIRTDLIPGTPPDPQLYVVDLR